MRWPVEPNAPPGAVERSTGSRGAGRAEAVAQDADGTPARRGDDRRPPGRREILRRTLPASRRIHSGRVRALAGRDALLAADALRDVRQDGPGAHIRSPSLPRASATWRPLSAGKCQPISPASCRGKDAVPILSGVRIRADSSRTWAGAAAGVERRRRVGGQRRFQAPEQDEHQVSRVRVSARPPLRQQPGEEDDGGRGGVSVSATEDRGATAVLPEIRGQGNGTTMPE
jgi:hypothetical protein